MNYSLYSPAELCRHAAARAKAARLAANLTQKGLADRAGVSLGSLKRFESTGAASLELVAKVAVALKMEDGLSCLFKPPSFASLDQAMESAASRKRGRRT